MKKYKTEKRFKFNRETEELEPYWVVYREEKKTKAIEKTTGCWRVWRRRTEYVTQKVKIYQGGYEDECGHLYYKEYEFSTKAKAQKYILTKSTT